MSKEKHIENYKKVKSIIEMADSMAELDYSFRAIKPILTQLKADYNEMGLPAFKWLEAQSEYKRKQLTQGTYENKQKYF